MCVTASSDADIQTLPANSRGGHIAAISAARNWGVFFGSIIVPDLGSMCPLCGRKWKYKFIDNKWVKMRCECASEPTTNVDRLVVG